MEDIYNDLENYDEVDLLNELRSENSELKHKLAECTTTMEMLQKSILQDFDKVSAEFKTLEMNYSSLLKIARAEIKRKTDMITNLNIEKDKLVIKATQSVPPNKVQQLIRNLGTDANRKKKKRNKGGGQKGKDEIRKDCERPPSSETSSTATDNTNKMLLSKERVDSLKSTCRIATKENEIHKPEWFPDHRAGGNRSPVGNIVDRRISTLARPPFSKLSSDEEFEDMYSALEPKTPSVSEPERSRKRGRDRSLDARTYNASDLQDKPSNYPEPFRERHVRSRSSRFSASDRNMNRDKEYNESDRNMFRDKEYNESDKNMFRDKQYNENDRNMNRDKQYNENDRNMNRDKQYNENDRNMNRDKQYNENMNRDKYDPHYRRYSPERHRRVGREFGDERYSQQYDRRRRLESPPRERYPAHSSRERRPPHDRERDEPKQGVRYNHPDTHAVRPRIHGEYDEPQNKRPRVEQHHTHQDDRRQSEQQYYKDIHPAEVRERTCQSPDFSHTENESSNEPMSVIESIDPTLEDPRISSTKYVKTTEGNKEVLQSANVNEIDLQPVNKSLWNLQVVHVPQALKQKPLEISEELVDQIDIDKPGSVLSMESGEVGSETTDTFFDDFSDHREVDKGVNSNYKCVSSKNDHIKLEKRKDKEKSPVEKTYKDVAHKRDLVQKESKPTRNKLEKLQEANSGCKADETPTMSFEDSNKDHNNMHSNDTEKPSILRKLVQLAGYNSEMMENHRVDKLTTKISKDSDNTGSNTHCDNTEKPSILQRLISSVSETHKSPESDNTVKSKITEKKEHNSDLTISTTSEKETESSVAIFRDFEHRVYSTRHIVEGDLHLSDDSNDEALVIKDEKLQVKKKQKTKKKSHRDASKEKCIESEDTTRRTRSKKDKGKEEKPQNKFCELFGDSSSLITPEELNLATREAHALPADCCPPLCEDAQDGLIQIQKPVQIHVAESKENMSGSVIMEDKLKTTRDSKNRTHHKKHKDMESILVSKDTQKDPKELLNEKVDSTDSQLVSGIKLVLSSEKLKEMQNAKITIDKNKNDSLKSHENPKEPVKSNKKSKSKHEKRLSVTEPSEDSNTKKANSLGTSSNKALVVGDNKENADCNDNSEKNISSEMAKIFEHTTDSNKNTFVESSKANEEKLQLAEKLTETISNTTDVPNLAPVTDEPGLVKTVVISTGNQHLDSNTVQCIKPLNCLASSTPAKDISAINTSSEIDPKKQTACVNVTIASEDSVSHSQSETDAPDVRINYYKRRRKVLKK